MTRILHVIHGLNLGGAENFIFNLLNALDDSNFIFDFVIQEDEIKHIKFKELIESRGGKIYKITDFFRNPLKHGKEFSKLLRKIEFDCIHIHLNALINPLPLFIASKHCPKVILHSHSTSNGKGGTPGKLIHKLNKLIFLRKDIIGLACSQEAGKWMFGNSPFTFISNAINLEKFSYSEGKRERIRKENNIGESVLIGQVGRLIPLKNQKFSINLLADLKRKYPDRAYKLMLLGDGDEKENLIKLIKEKDLSHNVIVKGNVHNAAEYYSAFDIFIMPSWFEGLAVSAIEAQGAGLKSVISDTVTKEVDQTDSVVFLPLNDKDKWIQTVNEISSAYDRTLISKKLVGSSFDIRNMTKTMKRIYNS